MSQKKLSIPIPLLILDAIGVLTLGIGLAEYAANTNLIPPSLQFEHYALYMMGAGIMLMLPMVIHIFKTTIAKPPRQV